MLLEAPQLGLNRLTATGGHAARIAALREDARSENFSVHEDAHEDSFRVWADPSPPTQKMHVWCRDSRETSIDAEYASAQIERAAHHLTAMVVHSLTTSPGLRPCHVVIQADGILRSFSTEKDVRRYLLHLAERTCAGLDPGEFL